MLSCLFNPMTCLEAHWMEMSQILTNLMQSLVKSLASLKETRLTIDIFINSHSNKDTEINGIIWQLFSFLQSVTLVGWFLFLNLFVTKLWYNINFFLDTRYASLYLVTKHVYTKAEIRKEGRMRSFKVHGVHFLGSKASIRSKWGGTIFEELVAVFRLVVVETLTLH